MKCAIVFSVRMKLKTLAIDVPSLRPNKTPSLKIKFWIYALLYIIIYNDKIFYNYGYLYNCVWFHFDAYQHSSSVASFMKEFC